MGLCHEFGSQIRAGCGHPMRAGASACSCVECGVVCRGLFDGCPDVWARGPRPVSISASPAANGAATHGVPGARGEVLKTIRAGTAAAAIGPGPSPEAGPDGARVESDDSGRHRSGVQVGAKKAGSHQSSRTDGAGDAPGDPRQEVFRWLEEAFQGVRSELQTLIGSMTHQQAMVAELLDSRRAELRLALVAESLPDVVADAVRAAMDDHNATMAQAYDRSHDQFRDDVERVRAGTEAKVDALHESFEKLASMITVHDEEAEQRETVRLGTLKGSVTRQITPLADALSRLSAKVEDLAARLDSPGSAPAGATAAPARSPSPAAPARPLRPPTRPTPAGPKAPTAPAPPVLGPARPSPSAWAPTVAVGPVVARRVTSNRAAVAAGAGDQEPVSAPAPAPAPAKRRSTAAAASRRRLAQATALPEPEPEVEPEVEPESEVEPMAEVELVTARPRRITTRRPAATRTVGDPPPAPANGSRSAVAPVRSAAAPVRRPSTARVTAPRASAPPEPPEPEPPTAASRRVLGRRPAPVEQPGPMVTYDLEDDPDGLFGVDEGDDAGWAPPAWVSEAAKRAAPGGGRSRLSR